MAAEGPIGHGRSDSFPGDAQLTCRLLTGQRQQAVEPGNEVDATWVTSQRTT